MIEVNHLIKKYGSHYAVNDLSFQVEKGQIYGFLGPNGAGKSTTMNIITGYLAPTAGEVKVDGHDIMKEPEEAKRCIGYLPEMPPVYPDMTVQEYLRFAAELKGIPSKDDPYPGYEGKADPQSFQRVQAESRTGPGPVRFSGGSDTG